MSPRPRRVAGRRCKAGKGGRRHLAIQRAESCSRAAAAALAEERGEPPMFRDFGQPTLPAAEPLCRVRVQQPAHKVCRKEREARGESAACCMGARVLRTSRVLCKTDMVTGSVSYLGTARAPDCIDVRQAPRENLVEGYTKRVRVRRDCWETRSRANFRREILQRSLDTTVIFLHLVILHVVAACSRPRRTDAGGPRILAFDTANRRSQSGPGLAISVCCRDRRAPVSVTEIRNNFPRARNKAACACRIRQTRAHVCELEVAASADSRNQHHVLRLAVPVDEPLIEGERAMQQTRGQVNSKECISRT